MKPSALALGTAQFGMNYGVTNTYGRMPFAECKKIISRCLEAGVVTIDTAAEYGDSEAILGQLGVSSLDVVSKFAPSRLAKTPSEEACFSQILKALDRLKISKLHALLIHDLDDVLENEFGKEAIKAMLRAKKEGLVEKIGVSIYEPEILERAINEIPIDIVQSPLNAFDQRLAETGWLGRLHANGVEVHTRSCFLQGLLLCDPSTLPSHLETYKPTLERWREWLVEKDLSPLEGCLAAIKGYSEVSKIIIGVNSVKHLDELLLAAINVQADNYTANTADKNLIDPRRWRTL